MVDCIICKSTCSAVYNYRKHILSQRHKECLQLYNLIKSKSNINSGLSDINSVDPNLIIMTNDKMFKCNYCELETKSPCNLREHIERNHKGNIITVANNNLHNNQDGNLNNEQSDEISYSESNIKKQFICTICNKSFGSNFSLKRHNKTVCGTVNIQDMPAELINKIKKTNTQKPKYNKDCKNETFNYVYLIEKYDLNNNKSIYKFGKTKRHIFDRLKEHGNEAKILYISEVKNCDITESFVLNTLRNNTQISSCPSSGREYFTCDNKYYLLEVVKETVVNCEKQPPQIIIPADASQNTNIIKIHTIS